MENGIPVSADSDADGGAIPESGERKSVTTAVRFVLFTPYMYLRAAWPRASSRVIREELPFDVVVPQALEALEPPPIEHCPVESPCRTTVDPGAEVGRVRRAIRHR